MARDGGRALTLGRLAGAGLAGLIGVALPAPAAAEEEEPSAAAVFGQPSVEASFGASYLQGLAKLDTAPGYASTGSGVAIDLGLDYRFTPALAFGARATYHVHPWAEAPDGGSSLDPTVHGVVAGVDGRLHFETHGRYDPWLRLGLGYRWLWILDPGLDTVTLDGPELLRFAAGLDLWPAHGIALGPDAGIDLGTLLHRVAERDAAIDDPKVTLFVHMGVHGLLNFDGLAPGLGWW